MNLQQAREQAQFIGKHHPSKEVQQNALLLDLAMATGGRWPLDKTQRDNLHRYWPEAVWAAQ